MKLSEADKGAIFEALGQASMCWNPIPTGIFNSSKAADIGGALIARLEMGQPPTIVHSGLMHETDPTTPGGIV